jgi:hypothetical protein
MGEVGSVKGTYMQVYFIDTKASESGIHVYPDGSLRPLQVPMEERQHILRLVQEL